MRLYDFHESGNGFKVRMLLALLGAEFERVEVDILKGESRTPAFLKLNPNGRVPVLELDDGRALAESNAILYYLSQGSVYWPSDRYDRASALQWMAFEQYSHEPYVAVLRFWRFSDQLDDHAHEVPERRRRGEAALDVMERHLSTHRYFAAGCLTIADLALYAYTHVAHEAGFDLSGRPNVVAWLERVAAEPGMVSITDVAPRDPRPSGDAAFD